MEPHQGDGRLRDGECRAELWGSHGIGPLGDRQDKIWELMETRKAIKEAEWLLSNP